METCDRVERLRMMAGVTPVWAAELIQEFGDMTSPAMRMEVNRRIAELSGRWSAIGAFWWEHARIRVLRAILSEARAHVPASEHRVLAAIDGVREWLARGAPADERASVRAVAAAATPEHSAAAVPAHSAAVWAAATWAAECEAVTMAATWAAEAAADAAAAAVWAASPEVADAAASPPAEWAADAAADTARAAAEAAAEWAADAARAAAWDRIAAAVLSTIEVECVRAEVL